MFISFLVVSYPASVMADFLLWFPSHNSNCDWIVHTTENVFFIDGHKQKKEREKLSEFKDLLLSTKSYRHPHMRDLICTSYYLSFLRGENDRGIE